MKTQLKLRTIGLFFLTIVTIISCSKKNTTPPKSKLALQVNAINSFLTLHPTAGPGVSGASSATIDWNSGFMNVSSIEAEDGVEPEKSSSESRESAESSKEDIITRVDLFIPNQQIGVADVAAGSYDSLRIKFQISQTPVSPALFLKGTYVGKSGSKTQVEFSLNEGLINSQSNVEQQGQHQGGEDDDLKIQATLRNLVVSAQSSTVATINLDYKKLLNGLTASDFDNAVISNGIIIINKTTNTNIYTKIKANINKFSKGD